MPDHNKILVSALGVGGALRLATKRDMRILLQAMGISGIILEITFLPRSVMKKIKKRYSDTPKKTSPESFPDVLAFREPPQFIQPLLPRWRFLGEIFLNRDYAGSEQGARRELLVHGVLHLLGYDHKRKKEALRMELLQKKFIKCYRVLQRRP